MRDRGGEVVERETKRVNGALSQVIMMPSPRRSRSRKMHLKLGRRFSYRNCLTHHIRPSSADSKLAFRQNSSSESPIS
jgi:hypothetical protein